MGIGTKRRAALARGAGTTASRVPGPFRGWRSPAAAALGGIPRRARRLGVLARPTEPTPRPAALSAGERPMDSRTAGALSAITFRSYRTYRSYRSHIRRQV